MHRQIFSLAVLITCTLGIIYAPTPSTGKNGSEQNFVQKRRPAVQGTDLSGEFPGYLDYGEAGFTGEATLTIDGNRFTLRGNGVNLSGTLVATQSGGRSFNLKLKITSPATFAKKVLSLTLTGGADRRIIISGRPNDSAKFYFSVNPPVGSDPGSTTNTIATNTNSIATNTNSIATNTNAITTNGNTRRRPPPSLPNFEPTPGDSRPRNANTNSRRPVNGQVPNVNAKATSGMPSQPPVASTSGEEPALFSQVRTGAHAVFTTPSTMRFEDTTDIEMVLSPTKTVAELESELTERGESKSAATDYSNLMEAQLVSDGFDVVPLGPSIQPVEAGRTTRWKWQIKPKAGGDQELKLTLNAVLSDGKNRIYLQTLKRDINVKVKLTQRAVGWLSGLKELHWLWAAIILPIATVVLAWWRRKKKPKARKKKSTRSAAGKSSQP